MPRASASDIPFLGTGWSFPPSFVKGTAVVVTVEGLEDIAQSLHILLSTTLGERVMRPTYGCDLHVDLFENLDTGLRAYLCEKVRLAVLYHEPRIRLDEVQVRAAALEGRAEIDVHYTVRVTNTRHNIVYPFYLDEAVNDGR